MKASLDPTAATRTPDYVVRVLPRSCEDRFPNIKALLNIGYTLPVGSADAERSFSCLPRLTTYLKGHSVPIMRLSSVICVPIMRLSSVICFFFER